MINFYSGVNQSVKNRINWINTFINAELKMELFSNGFSLNGSSECNMDNLEHVRVKQYIKKMDDACETVATDISMYREKNHKYSKFLANIILLLSSIENISYEKSE